MTGPTEVVLPGTTSYSQVNSFNRCGWAYALERVMGFPSQPNWAAVGGSGVHAATEWWDRETLKGNWTTDRDQITAAFTAAFEDAITAQVKRSGFQPEDFRATGTRAKSLTKSGGPNKKDRDWWMHYGPEMCMAWVTWRQSTPWELADIGDTFGIEVPVELPSVGGKPLKGFIDRVFTVPTGDMVIVDLKTGQEPDDTKQLGTYADAMEKQYGERPAFGTYWMGDTGGTTVPEPLSEWTPERLDFEYGAAHKAMEAGLFVPKKTRMCSGCGVREHCYAYGGERAGEAPKPWEISVVTPPSVSTE